jgi:hypothetical protein
MDRHRAALALVLGAGLLGAATANGGVYVTTLPSGADIWVDGTYVGRSPVLVDALSAGHHALTITKTGWVVREVDVEVPPAGVAMSSTALAAGSGPATARTNGLAAFRGIDAGASLLLDDQPVQGDPRRPQSLTPGTHTVVLITPHGRFTRTFTVLSDTTTEVVVRADVPDAGRSGVVAPAADYLPDSCVTVEGGKIVVRYEGHLVVAHLGDATVRFDGVPAVYDGAPETIAGRLYLPLELLKKLTDDPSKSK